MKQELKDRLLFLGPLLILPGLLVAWPLFEIVILGFKTRVTLFGIDRWVGLDNYQYLFGGDFRFWKSVTNTLYFTGVSVMLEFFIGFVFALYLRFGAGSVWWKTILLLPWAIPNVVSARLWQWMFHSEAGIVNHILQTLGAVKAPVYWLANPDLALHAAILADVWKTTPFMTLLLFAGLQRVPESLLMAARVDRTPPLRLLMRILLPALRRVILTALVLRFLDAFRVFDVIYVMTGGGPANSTETLSIYAYRTYFQALQFGYGSSVALVQVGMMIALTWLVAAVLKDRRQTV
ncbi:ABC-type sugar transport system, permease component [Nitrospina gracilis 3/211]|uniref:ABC-type sugar transport system, permease component n=1 Tax=Nitrospina gracilis (strain 3/211) TaxID=1266370 RepID=M1ZEU4_NITG3|nr:MULTISPECIES: sugar ABC transporter permease [Nitrospina]MCF8721992.1 multiple sugar transport system permease protein [Nitrospina sp. Nb-3]CCQ92118.1 ABC-type sugar transport system, permease component [Nitrospina gracilis 3/211]